MELMIVLKLPYPPSLNHYYRHVGPRVLISREGRLYRERITAILQSQGVTPMTGPVELELEIYPPDYRRRDLDNTLKGLLDSLQAAGAYGDDSQIVRLEAFKREPLPPDGVLAVRIFPHV